MQILLRSFHLVTIFLLLLNFIGFNGFGQEKTFKVATVAFYNVENLFDTIDQPDVIDEEFLPQGTNLWTSPRYLTKLDRIGEVLTNMCSEFGVNGPLVVGLSEIENRSVLEDLVNSPRLKPMNYGVAHFDSPDRRGVDVGMIYQKDHFQVVTAKSVRLFDPNDTSFLTRDQLVVSGILDGEKFHFIVNHWPSRRGGEKRSAPKRNAAAQLCRGIVDSLQKIDPTSKIVIMGDLNDDPINESVTKHLKAKNKDTDLSPTDLYNPMFKMYKDGIGSLAYQDSWNLFDQMIVSAPLVGTDFSNFKLFKSRVFNDKMLIQKEGQYTGYPFRTYVGSNYQGGYSDHFPVYIVLIREKK